MEKEIQELILKNLSESRQIYQNFEKAICSKFNFVLAELEKEIKLYLKGTEWEVEHKGQIHTSKDRGMIWVRPKFLNNNWVIGIEDINPIFYSHNFEHRIFIGVRSDKGSREYFNLLSDSIRNENYGGWNDYVFIKDFKEQEVRGNNDDFIELLHREDYTKEFVKHLFVEFKNYFEIHSQHLMQIVNKNELDLLDFRKNTLENFENINLMSFYEFFKTNITKDSFEKVSKIWIWADKKDASRSCFVVDFKDNFRFDFLLRDNQCFIQFIHLENTSFREEILQEIESNLLANGRYESKIGGNTIGDVLNNLNNKIQIINDITT